MSFEQPKSVYFEDFLKTIPDQTGRVVVITGTTSGTGYIAARTSLQKGANVVILNRESSRAQETVRKLTSEVPASRERLTWIKCDLQDFDSVRNAAKEITRKYPNGIHVLANNAGVMALKNQATKDGYDIQMQTNHLSHFLLTKELFPSLQKAAQSATKEGEIRVVNHSSTARMFPMTPLRAEYFGKNGPHLGNDNNSMAFGGRWQRYHQSKLANSVFTLELAERLAKKDAQNKIYAVCAHPGFACTELQSTAFKDDGISSIDGMMKYSQSAEDGAIGLLKGMFATDVIQGAMYGPRLLTGPATHRYHGFLSSSSAMKMLWAESEKAVGKFAV